MPKKKYTITDKDYYDAWDYLSEKLQDEEWLAGKYDYEYHQKASRAFKRATENNEPEKLNQWAEKYLNGDQWNKLKNVIIKRRSRHKKRLQDRVQLYGHSATIIKELAEHEGIGYSEYIIKRLEKEWQKL